MPTGELPRNILMAVDRSMVGTIAPGTRITAVAIYSTVQVHDRRLRCAIRDAVACHALPVRCALHTVLCIDPDEVLLLTDRV